MTPALLREIGEAFPDGIRGLAKAIAGRRGGASDSMRRSLTRWAAGRYRAPEWLPEALREALAEQGARLRELRKRLG